MNEKRVYKKFLIFGQVITIQIYIRICKKPKIKMADLLGIWKGGQDE